MANLTLIDCLQPELVTVERVNYFPRQLLTADDMFADQEYFRLKLRRHNRFMHGWGTVCGLVVSPAPTSAQPWLVQISGGYALGPYGDEIFVAEPVFLDLSQCGSAVTDPCEPGMLIGMGGNVGVGATVYVAIQYSECMARPVRVMPSGCGCEQTACENSRIRDSFQVQCLPQLPSSYQLPPPQVNLCDFINNQVLPDCPACPSDPWVVLAAVTLPVSLGVQLTNANIDNFTVRRQIFSTAVLQEQLIECCCGPAPTPTPAPALADLQVGQAFSDTTDPNSGFAGLLLTITVTNNGPAASVNVSLLVNLTLDLGISVVPAPPLSLSGNNLQANLGTLSSGQTVSLTATFLPVAGVEFAGPNVASTASVQSNVTPDPNMANNTSIARAQLPTVAEVTQINPANNAVLTVAAPTQVVVNFSKRLQPSSINTNNFQVVMSANNTAVQGTVTYDDPSMSATFTPTAGVFGNFQSYQVTVFGSGAAPVFDIDGLALDGDGDGKPGGNFTSSFSVDLPI